MNARTVVARSGRGASRNRSPGGGRGAIAALAGAGVGAGLMFALDPDRGRRRRALARDQAMRFGRRARNAIEATLRDLENRVRGFVADIDTRLAAEDVPDEVLVQRVRAKLGQNVSHPGPIEVVALGGRVALSGPILRHEVGRVLRRVRRIPGVREVEDRLEVHEDAGTEAALQGGTAHSGERWEFLQERWSPTARLVAGLAGGLLATLGATRRDPLVGLLGAGLVTRAATNLPVTRLVGMGDAGR